MSEWPDVYRNAETGAFYMPHSADEARFVYSDGPRHVLVKGGEGSGKSVAGFIKALERARREMHGIAVSPDLQHFKKSLWVEMRRWIPWHCVTPAHRRMQRLDWEPPHTFQLVFTNGATMLCGGIEEPGAWEGPNVHYALFDEGRRHKTPAALKVLAGRIRLLGPGGEPPQLWLSSTPRKNWMYEYFGPWENPGEADPLADFKRRSWCLTLRTEDNAHNLAAGYVEDRASSLTAQERRVLLDAEWEDIADAEAFLENIILWDACKDELPPPTKNEPCVLGADAGVSSDCFALVLTSRHPRRRQHVAERLTKVHEPRGGRALNFALIEQDIRDLCKMYNVAEICYDPYQLHQMMTTLRNDGVVMTRPFNQGTDRLIADKQLLDIIIQRTMTHSGNATLRQHIANADRKKDADKLRIVKRVEGLKIDAAVALSMSVARCLKLPL